MNKACVRLAVGLSLVGCRGAPINSSDLGLGRDMAAPADAALLTDMAPFATVNGTLQGATLTVADTAYGTRIPGGGGSNTVLVLTGYAGVCTQLDNNHLGKNGQVLVLSVLDYDTVTKAQSAISAPGTYVVFGNGTPTSHAAGGNYFTTTMTCQVPANEEPASSGTVTITALSASSISGTFDVILGSDHVTGSFTAPFCAGVSNTFSTAACM